jgi:hypothetical protein
MTRHDTNCPVLVRNGECGHLPGCEGGDSSQRERDLVALTDSMIDDGWTPGAARMIAKRAEPFLAEAREQGRREAAGNNE